MARRNSEFHTIRSDGGLLPTDLLLKVISADGNLEGTGPQDYGLAKGEQLNEAIAQSWNRLKRHWADFRKSAETLEPGAAGTGITNEKWNLPLLKELGFGPLPTSAGPEIGGKTYAISRFLGPVPIHLVGYAVRLDRRTAGVRGAAAVNPHGLVQEYLNRTDQSLWAILSNGQKLRVLRDNHALSRQSYLEFDLEAMFDGGEYSDFRFLWSVVHETRFRPAEKGKLTTCLLEKWTKLAQEEGTRALESLQGGVEQALVVLGEGLTSHPKNIALRERLRSGGLSPNELHSQLLRVVYRLIFLFVSEERTLEGHSLIHPIDDSAEAAVGKKRYREHYSGARLRELAAEIKGTRHGDLWKQFQVIVVALSGEPEFETTRQKLALPSLGSFLWNPGSTADLNDCELTNFDFLEAIRNLAFTRSDKVLQPVNYKDLGAEELGGVYESLLSLTPQLEGDGARFTFAEFAGNERKTSGSYYTPDSLVQCLLDSALDPVVDEAVKGKTGADAEEAILALNVCDPAVGSGHFLVGAARRLAGRLARIRATVEGESEPSPLYEQHALRDVIARCLYGVDINPMAAELCKVGLWLESMEPGKPLSFLDHHIRVGNSLLGTTPALLKKGIPDDAFKAIEGDDKSLVRDLKKRNKRERADDEAGQQYLYEQPLNLGNVSSEFTQLSSTSDDSVAAVAEKERLYAELVSGADYKNARLLADTWCAVFVWQKDTSNLGKQCPTERNFRKIESDPHSIPLHVKDEVRRLADQYQFFHWHLAFPDVFRLPSEDKAENEQTGWNDGFHVVLGNPPWDVYQPEADKFFAARNPVVLDVKTAAARKKRIAALEGSDPDLFREWGDYTNRIFRSRALIKSSQLLPLTSYGKVNLYSSFGELAHLLLAPAGLGGIIVPTGLVTDEPNKLFMQSLFDGDSIESAFSFENREGHFPDVDSRYRFCLLTLRGDGSSRVHEADFAFFLSNTGDLATSINRFRLSAHDIRLLNPNTRTCPIFRSNRDADLTKHVYRRVPPFQNETAEDGDPWSASLLRVYMMDSDSHLFVAMSDASGESLEPLYEAKLIWHFDHRYATFAGVAEEDVRRGNADEFLRKGEPCPIQTRFFVPRDDVSRRYQRAEWPNSWALGIRDITNATNERTVVTAVIPRTGAANSLPLIATSEGALGAAYVSANCNSFCLDYVARQKVGGVHINWYLLQQFPITPPPTYDQPSPWTERDTIGDWINKRVLELTYTAWDLEAFALDCGYAGPPFRWDEERRFLLRCELDAAFFHLYLPADANGDWKSARQSEGCPYDETPEQLAELKRHFPTPHDAVDYIMETFPIVKRKDIAAHGDYRTKLIILDIYKKMKEAIDSGEPYKTNLDPPPGPPVDADGVFIPMTEWDENNWPKHIHPPREEN